MWLTEDFWGEDCWGTPDNTRGIASGAAVGGVNWGGRAAGGESSSPERGSLNWRCACLDGRGGGADDAGTTAAPGNPVDTDASGAPFI